MPNRVPAAGLRQLFFEDPNGVRVEINVQDAWRKADARCSHRTRSAR